MQLIDGFLNRITMYRLVLYYLIAIIITAVGLSFFHILTYDPVAIIASALFLYFFSSFINDLLAKYFQAPTNIESAYISALILALIINPVKSVGDFIFLGVAVILTMMSKYILNINYKHLFNPVAIAVVLTAFGLGRSASWWVGNPYLLPVVVAGGLLVVRKIRREDMVFCFILVTIMTSLFFKASPDQILLHSSLFFFAFVMLTEPLTTPPTRSWQIIYGVIAGFLFNPSIHLGPIYSTPELSLVAANIFSYVTSPKEKLILHLKEKIKLSADTFDFVFPLKKKLSFSPGQYMEWTLTHNQTDNRGNRRYFTIASSPTEDTLRIGVKFYDQSSSYKKSLMAIDKNTPIVVGQRAGDFTLPADKKQKLVFIAGGIGVTPFRSILKYLIDKNERRDIVFFYSNKNEKEIVYRDIFDEAVKKLGIKVVYILTEKIGRLNTEMIKKEAPDYQERIFYLSGPHAMVTGFEKVLQEIGVKNGQIKTDFFPGFV